MSRPHAQHIPMLARGQMEVASGPGTSRAIPAGNPGDVLTVGPDRMPVFAAVADEVEPGVETLTGKTLGGVPVYRLAVSGTTAASVTLVPAASFAQLHDSFMRVSIGTSVRVGNGQVSSGNFFIVAITAAGVVLDTSGIFFARDFSGWVEYTKPL